MRKLIYYVACTLDGFIAHEDGSFDGFLTEGEHFIDLFKNFPETIPSHLRSEFGVDAENQHFDAVLMGRKTYEVGVAVGVTNPYPHMQQYLFSQSFLESPDPAVELVTKNPLAKVKELKQGVGKDIWLCGGGEVATQLFSEIDELILKVNPVVIGKGIPLFRGEVKPTAVEVLESKSYPNGFRVDHYRVKHAEG